MKAITRVLIANRGEIAVRIIRACKALGIETVAAVSEADRESLAARMADKAVCIGPPRALDSYLKAETLVAAALGTRSDAVHPGYGFLAEQPELAESCEKHGLIFIGPTPENLRQMGNKLMAREMVAGYRIPTIPGSKRVGDAKEAIGVAEKLGFPILLKAAAGGGGKGIVIVKDPVDLAAAFDTTSAEARAAFGDGTLYIEHFVSNARHIEVQVLADPHGNVIHLGERDCSIQRRYQKVIEESPSPALSPELRGRICQAAVTIARNISYRNAGTVEFILDQDTGEFFFLEMNTRIQVEHPVTELVTGVDLVQEQIKIASGEPVGFSQEGIKFRGHSIECRINAESPEAGFRPCPGRIEKWVPPQSEGIRVDTHCYPGYFVPPYYDSLLAKVITQGATRFAAIERMRYALKNFVVSGVDTVIPFLARVLEDPEYVSGKVNTRWLEHKLGTGQR